MAYKKQLGGFTIVELLIVIVVIGILAAIILVAYNGIQNRATVSVIQSAASQASQKVMAYSVQNSDLYPSTLADAGVTDNGNTTYQYSSDNVASPHVYCVTVTSGDTSYYISSTKNGIQEGICPGHNLLVWNKSQAGAPTPVPNAIVDTSVFRTSIASLRIGPNTTNQPIRGSPFSGTAGQVYTVSFWMKTDSTWNGTGNNSKIRVGNPSGGTLLTACSYGGVKLSWTQVTCSYTMTSVSPISISLGNDGSVGNIWIDDFSISLSE